MKSSSSSPIRITSIDPASGGGGGGGSATWGSIAGLLSNQTDLENALSLKAPLANPAFTGFMYLNTPGFSDSGILEQLTGNANGYQQELIQNKLNLCGHSKRQTIKKSPIVGTLFFQKVSNIIS